jgi:hypothetical protein
LTKEEETVDSDVEFGIMLAAPHASNARQKGFDRALAAGVPPQRAAAMCGLTVDEIGAVRVLRKARRLARSTGRAARRGARMAVRLHPLALAAQGAKFAGHGLAAATRPIRRGIFRAFFRKLIGRRARLLSWQRRQTLHPTASEQAEAHRWAIQYVRRHGLLGKLVGTALSGDIGAEPATTALVTASIPVILQLARRALKMAESQGAPSDPRSEEPEAEPAPDAAESPTE